MNYMAKSRALLSVYEAALSCLIDSVYLPEYPKRSMKFAGDVRKAYPRVGREEHPFVINGMTIMAVDKKTAKKIYERKK